jgi:glutamyl-tRNA synthetase
MSQVRVRFAPSPTGYLHVGNARTALFNWLFARQKKGVFILRVEDTDVERSRHEYYQRLISDLRWLGLDWDEGPDVGGDYGPYLQSERLEIYQHYTQQLLESGLAYYCFCSPEELEQARREALARGKMPIYSGKCRHIPPEEAAARIARGEKAAVRLKTPDQGEIAFNDLVRGHLHFQLEVIGDPILVRSNGLPAYNYAVVIDDHLMEVTHVIRGEDHISNTPRQILTYQALGWTPPLFAHLAMVMGEDNTRLSKRHGATSVDQFAREGILPQALFNYLALLGWSPPEGHEILSREELVELFDLTRVSRSAAIFDYQKLYWLNRQHLKRLSPAEKVELGLPFLQQAGLLPEELTPAHRSWLEKAVEALVEGLDKLADLPQKFKLFFEFDLEAMDEEAQEILRAESAKKVLQTLVGELNQRSTLSFEEFSEMARQVREKTGVRGKELFHPIRVALTGQTSGLELDKFIPLIEEGAKLSWPRPLLSSQERIARTLEWLG